MNALILIGTLIGNLTVTSYRPVKEQTDSSPFYTSTKEHVRAGGCAVSRDLLCGACRKLHRRCDHPDNPTKLHYGDWLYIGQYGFRQVNDVMGDYTTQRVKGKKVRIPLRRRIDIFVWTWNQEHAVGVREIEVFKVEASQGKSTPDLYEVNGAGTIKGGVK